MMLGQQPNESLAYNESSAIINTPTNVPSH